MKRTIRRMIAIAFAIKVFLRGITAAYIDPSTGGMIFQVLAVLFAFFSGIIFFFSRQIKTFLARVRRSISHKPDEES